MNSSHLTTLPRLICEHSDAATTLAKECGAGLELGIKGTAVDDATSLNASNRFDLRAFQTNMYQNGTRRTVHD